MRKFLVIVVVLATMLATVGPAVAQVSPPPPDPIPVGYVTGVVQDEAGKPVSWAIARMFSNPAGPRNYIGWGFTDQDGVLSIPIWSDIPDGWYTIEIQGYQYQLVPAAKVYVAGNNGDAGTIYAKHDLRVKLVVTLDGSILRWNVRAEGIRSKVVTTLLIGRARTKLFTIFPQSSPYRIPKWYPIGEIICGIVTVSEPGAPQIVDADGLGFCAEVGSEVYGSTPTQQDTASKIVYGKVETNQATGRPFIRSPRSTP